MLKLEKQGAVDVMRPVGPLREQLLDECQVIAERLVEQGCPAIVLDLGQTVMLNGKSLEWLRELDLQCAEHGGSLSVAGATDLCAEALRITGVGVGLQQFRDVASAVARYAS